MTQQFAIALDVLAAQPKLQDDDMLLNYARCILCINEQLSDSICYQRACDSLDSSYSMGTILSTAYEENCELWLQASSPV